MNNPRSLGPDEKLERRHSEAPILVRWSQRQSSLPYRVLIAGLIIIISTFYFSPLFGSLTNFNNRSCLKNLSFEQRAEKILKENPLIDGHNDLLISLRSHFENHIYGSDFKNKFEEGGMPQHVDLPRLDKGLQGGAFWSAFVPCPPGNGTDFSDERYSKIVKITLEQLDLFQRLGQAYPKYFTQTTDSSQALEHFKKHQFISPAAIEGLHQIGNSISTLRLYHQLGVRYATLTWNCHNKYADAALESGPGFVPQIATPFWHGLSPAGRDIVKEMNRMGMLVDLAHVSQDTMRDVLVGNGKGDWNGSYAPPIFSHSSAYSICPHPRNVPDDILWLVKKRNSVVMVNFSPDFISCIPGKSPEDLPETIPANATLYQVVRHIRHIGDLIGYDHVGIGTDYDGIGSTPSGLDDVSKFPDLVAELLRQGISDEDAGKIVGRNILRVWRDADEIAKRLQMHVLPLEDEIQGWNIMN